MRSNHQVNVFDLVQVYVSIQSSGKPIEHFFIDDQFEFRHIYIYIYILFCLLLHRLALITSLPFHIFRQPHSQGLHIFSIRRWQETRPWHTIACMTGALWAKRDERDISRGARHEREARTRGEKNKAPVRSPLLLLFRQCSTVHQVDGHADWSISTTWWWLSVIKMSKQKWRPWVWKKRQKFSQYRLFKGWTEEMYRSTATEERHVGFVTNRIW